MARRAIRIPKELRNRMLIPTGNFNHRNNNSIGRETYQLMLDFGHMSVEDYVEMCEKQLEISPQQAIKELRVDLGTEKVVLSHAPVYPKHLDTDVKAEGVDLPEKLAKIKQEVDNERSSLEYERENVEFIKKQFKSEENRIKRRIEEVKKEEQAAKELTEEAERMYDEAKEGLKCPVNLADPKDNNGAIYPEWWTKFESLIKIRQNTLLVGPSGCGKTYLARELAEHLNLRFGSISCSAGVSETAFLGRRLPINGGNFKYCTSVFMDMFENGGLMLLDELDAADENTLIIINSALANDKIHIDLRYEKPEFTKHPDFVVVAAANTLGHGGDEDYQRNVLDAATLDRFRAGVIMCKYSKRVEQRLVNKNVYEWAIKIREYIKSRRMNHIMSTRQMLDFSRQADSYNWGHKEWERSYFANWSEAEIEMARREGIVSDTYSS